MPTGTDRDTDRLGKTYAGASAPEPKPKPLDPASVVAETLLVHAFRDVGVDIAALPTGGLAIVIQVPRPDWVPVIEKVWQTSVQQAQGPEDGYRDSWYRESSWTLWSPDEEPTRLARKTDSENFAKAIAFGRNCLGIAADVEWLPRDLLLSADHRVTVSPPSSQVIRAAAKVLTQSSPRERLDDDQAICATPRLLRLAYRPDRQSADDYLRKLREIIEQETKVEPPQPASLRSQPTLDRLHGMAQAVEWGFRLRDDLRAVQAGSITWAEVDRGCLLSGPPGCGKTLFARALAATCGVPLVSGSYSQWLGTGGGHQGDLLRAMRASFAEAKRKAPAILFVDEIDSFPNRNTVTHNYKDWEVQVVNALLTEVDGVDGRDGVILIGACNNPERLDPALVRSGRLDRHIRVELPDREDLARILREHLGNDIPDVDLSLVLLWAAGMSGADCERVVREARQRARSANRPLIAEDLEWVVSGRGHPELPAADLWTVCVHEAGHAVIGLDLGFHDLRAVAVGGSTAGALGTTHGGSAKNCVTASDVQARVMSWLAGRAAEEVFLGRPSSGAGGGADSDLARATTLLVAAHTTLGLAQDVPPLWLGETETKSLAVLLASQPTIAAGVSGQLTKAYEDLKHLVRRRRGAIHKVALALRQKRVMDGAEVKAIVQRYPPGEPSDWQEPVNNVDDTDVGQQ